MYILSSKWYGWIPTNRGKINFSFISKKNIDAISNKYTFESNLDQIKINKLDISITSDSNSFKKYRKGNDHLDEILSFADIIIKKDIKNLEGDIKIYSEYFEFSSKFTIELNGKIEFTKIFYDVEKFKDNIKEIQILMYILIKTIVHGDSHHHQKIDIALPIVEDLNNYHEIITESFIDYIKLVERNIKNIKDCNSKLRSDIFVYEIKGYISYLKTFLILFDKDEKDKNSLKFADNVFSSLESTVNKRKIKGTYRLAMFTSVITFIGLFISSNILLNGFWKQSNNDVVNFMACYSRMDMLLLSLSIILLAFYSNVKCNLSSMLYYKAYDIYELIDKIKYAKFRNLNLRGKIIKIIPLICFTISLSLIMYMFKDFFKN